MGKPGLYQLIVRKEHVACMVCGKTEPVHPGDGIPAETFIIALEAMGLRHAKCKPGRDVLKEMVKGIDPEELARAGIV